MVLRWKAWTMAKSDHSWQDDALRPDGRAWMSGIRFVCRNGCGVERRVVLVGEHGETASRFVLGGAMVKGGQPPCVKEHS